MGIFPGWHGNLNGFSMALAGRGMDMAGQTGRSAWRRLKGSMRVLITGRAWPGLDGICGAGATARVREGVSLSVLSVRV